MWMSPLASTISREPSTAHTDQPLGEQLKTHFDSLTVEPLPDRLLRLTEALEAAFERGEFQCGGRPAPSR